MVSSPEQIWDKFNNKKISQTIALEMLKTLIEKSVDEGVRIKAIKILDKLNLTSDYVFKLLENLLLSDESRVIRNLALQIIGVKFTDRALTPLEFAIDHEKEYFNLIEIIKWLGKTKTASTRLILYNHIKKILKQKHYNKDNKTEIRKLKKSLKELRKENLLENFTSNELAEILINYYSIINIMRHHPNVFFELDSATGLVMKLDLSNHEFEVKGTPFWWRNDIKTLSDVPGIEFLTNTHYLDLSNNEIFGIKKILYLPNLTHLVLTNNKIDGQENLSYLKKLPNLKYLDLRGNEIIHIIKPDDFRSSIRVLLRESF